MDRGFVDERLWIGYSHSNNKHYNPITQNSTHTLNHKSAITMNEVWVDQHTITMNVPCKGNGVVFLNITYFHNQASTIHRHIIHNPNITILKIVLT